LIFFQWYDTIRYVNIKNDISIFSVYWVIASGQSLQPTCHLLWTVLSRLFCSEANCFKVPHSELNCIHNLPNGTVLIFSAAYWHPVSIVGETHSAGAVCSSQLNYLKRNTPAHCAAYICTNRYITWVFCEVFVVRNFCFLLVWIVCSHIHIHSFRLLMCLHLQGGVFQHSPICIDCALAYAGHVLNRT